MKRLPFGAKVFGGVTLVEMLIGMAVLGVLMALAAPSLAGLLERRRVVAAAGEVSNMLAYARSETSVVADQINVHMEPVSESVGDFSCIRITNGAATDTCGCNRKLSQLCTVGKAEVLREFVLPRSTSVRFDGPAMGPYVVTFLRGTHSTYADSVRVTVQGIRTGAKLQVQYNNAGRVRICSPDSSITGYPSCG